jgi:RNA polymerase sigma factor (TIGR02999 family)
LVNYLTKNQEFPGGLSLDGPVSTRNDTVAYAMSGSAGRGADAFSAVASAAKILRNVMTNTTSSGQSRATEPGEAEGKVLSEPGEPVPIVDYFQMVHEELRCLARIYMQTERPDHTLQPTALVHEAYLRLSASNRVIENRAHFFALAATAMRRILVEHARAKGRIRRNSGVRDVPLETVGELASDIDIDVVALDDALTELAGFDARKSQIIELIYFGGLNVEETAEVIAVSAATVHRELRLAKAWLRQRIAQTEP